MNHVSKATLTEFDKRNEQNIINTNRDERGQ